MTPTATKPQPEEEGISTETEPGLLPRDRCDGTASGSEQAFVRLKNADTGHTVQLCSHHFNRHEASLIGKNFTVVEDIRSGINSKPSPSASVIAETADTPGLDEDDAFDEGY